MIDASREAELRHAIEEFYFAYRAFTALPDAILAERGLARTHHRVLYFVAQRPGIGVGELLDVLDISKQAAHRPVKELIEQGLLASAPDPADGRVRRLSVTPQGRALESELSTAQMHLLSDAFARAGHGAEAGWLGLMADIGAAAGASAAIDADAGVGASG